MVKYIRCKDYTTLYSDDNWATYKVAKNESPEGKEETNKDISTEVKLRYMLGEDKAKIIIGELYKIRTDFQLQKKDGYGHAFEIFAISVLYNIDYDVVYDNYIIQGQEDGKIDAIYWSESQIEVYQIKLDFLDLNDLNVMKTNYVEFLKTGNISNSNTSSLLSFLNKHKRDIKFDKDVVYKTISTNNSDKNNIKPEEIFKKFFENIIISKENNIKLELSVPMYNGVARLNDKKNVYAYFVSAKEFIDNILNCSSIRKKENLYKLFYDNVRGYLGINKALEDTIEHDSSNFVKYNNGITITGEVQELTGTGGNFIVNNPVINNGQQTIQNLIDKYPDIDGVDLLIILKNENNEKVKAKISQYTNSQRLIKPIDLLSLDSSLRNLQKQLFHLTKKEKEENFFLELNTSGTKSYQKVVKKIYAKNNIISLTEFCKLYFSVEDYKLGNWKSNISTMLGELLNKAVEYSLEKSLLICKISSKYKNYLDSIEDKNVRNIVKTADLAFMFIMYKYNLNEEETHKIIDEINDRYYYNIPEADRKSKLIDLYKSNTIAQQIKEVIEDDKESLATVTVD